MVYPKYQTITYIQLNSLDPTNLDLGVVLLIVINNSSVFL